MTTNKFPGIKEVSLDDPNKPTFDAIKIILEMREGLRGTVEERGITGQDLIDLGLATKEDLEKIYRNR